MTWRNVRTIFWKDLRDAIRDARVLVAIVVPFGIGLFYNLTFDDESTRPHATVAYTAADQTQLPEAIHAVVQNAVDLAFLPVETEADVERIVGADDADLGLVIPAGFDAAIARGERPTLRLIQPPSTSFGGDYVAAAIEPALTLLAGIRPPATIDVARAQETDQSRSVIDIVGLRVWAVFGAIVMMVAMIAMLAVPVILAEETEKRTLDALVLIASYADVVIAKALIGAFFSSVTVVLLLVVTGLAPDDGLLFGVTVILTTTTLIGFGLLLGGLFKSANQLNTWSGVLLIPVIAPAFIVGLPTPDLLEHAASLFPTGGATKLLLNSAVDETVFANPALSFTVIVVWGIAAYVLLFWQLSRRQA